jgi:hypothetical protein
VNALSRIRNIDYTVTDRLKMRSNVYVALDELPGYLKVDFSDCRVKQVSETAEADHYLHRTSLTPLRPVLAGEMSWEAYFLTFRFRNRRVPDEYDSAIIIFLFTEPDTYAFASSRWCATVRAASASRSRSPTAAARTISTGSTRTRAAT